MAEIIGVVHSKGKKGVYYVPVPKNIDITKASFGAIVNEENVKVSLTTEYGHNGFWKSVDITNRTITFNVDPPFIIYVRNNYCRAIISNDFTKDIIIYYTIPEETETETSKTTEETT